MVCREKQSYHSSPNSRNRKCRSRWRISERQAWDRIEIWPKGFAGSPATPAQEQRVHNVYLLASPAKLPDRPLRFLATRPWSSRESMLFLWPRLRLLAPFQPCAADFTTARGEGSRVYTHRTHLQNTALVHQTTSAFSRPTGHWCYQRLGLLLQIHWQEKNIQRSQRQDS